MKTSKFDLNNHLVRLLFAEPFWGSLSRQLDKVATDKIPTAGVRVSKKGRYELIYNPAFMERMIVECVEAGNKDAFRWVLGILKHEFSHLVLGHCTHRAPEGGMNRRHNIAMDLAINSHLVGELPPSACMPGVGPYSHLPRGLAYEAYLNHLPDAIGEDGEDDGQFDDHSGWDGQEPDDKSVARHRLKEAVKRAHNEANAQGWGSVSAEMRGAIEKALTSRVDWRKVLRSFVRSSVKANRRSSVRKINRRFPYIHAGKKSERSARLAISIDQSGSVSDRMLGVFFSELEKLSSMVEITIIPFDTRVDPELVFVWKKGEKRPAQRVMCGGTCFDAPTEYVNGFNFDGHIILTDMEAPKPVPSKCQRMWMTDERGVKHLSWETSERVIEIAV